MPLGICYQTAKTFDPTSANKYGAKGVAILAAMSDPNHQMIGSTPIQDRDDGYGIRFYGVTMGIGYDWFHDLLTPALQTQLQNTLNTWIHAFENDSQIAFEYEQVLATLLCRLLCRVSACPPWPCRETARSATRGGTTG